MIVEDETGEYDLNNYLDLDAEPDEPDEPPCWCTWDEFCWLCVLPPARVRRQHKRRWRQQRRQWRKVERHANDRFWQARNTPPLDDQSPF